MKTLILIILTTIFLVGCQNGKSSETKSDKSSETKSDKSSETKSDKSSEDNSKSEVKTKTIDGITYNADKEIGFYENGKVSSGYLARRTRDIRHHVRRFQND